MEIEAFQYVNKKEVLNLEEEEEEEEKGSDDQLFVVL